MRLAPQKNAGMFLSQKIKKPVDHLIKLLPQMAETMASSPSMSLGPNWQRPAIRRMIHPIHTFTTLETNFCKIFCEP